MKRYTKKSKVQVFRLVRSALKEKFYAEIIEEPKVTVKENLHETLLTEIHDLAKRAWGDFEEDYLKKSVLNSSYLCLLRDNEKKLVGFTPIKRLKIGKRIIYSFGLSVVDPDYQGLGLLKMMSGSLIRRIFIENILRGKVNAEFLFITPNIRTMGTIARVADFIYPNPYLIDEKTGKIEDADDVTWGTVQEYLKISEENYRDLDRNGCVMVGFYDDKPHLIKKNENVADKKLNLFAKNYLKPGNEVVVRAIISLGSAIKDVI